MTNAINSTKRLDVQHDQQKLQQLPFAICDAISEELHSVDLREVNTAVITHTIRDPCRGTADTHEGIFSASATERLQKCMRVVQDYD